MVTKKNRAGEKQPLLNGPKALWAAFQEHGGLDLRYHEDMDADVLSHLDSDHWGASVIGRIYHAARSAGVDDLRTKLKELFAGVPVVMVEEERLAETLLAFLNLPAWQRRYELYSAWIFTLIVEALGERSVRIHHDSGRLSFSFAGSHLATADLTDPRLHVWAELRSPLAKRSRLSGRKAIQPDYTLISDPISESRSAVAVVECKQYRNHSQKNFSAAVADYANGRPDATIFLASYGPARPSLLKGLPPETAARVRVCEHLRPHDDARRSAFCSELKSVIDRRYPTLPPLAERIPIGAHATRLLESVTLTWGASPRDLDLHLYVIDSRTSAEVHHGRRGSLESHPWAALDDDVRSGSGPETITVTRMVDGMYHCVVMNYSNETPLHQSGASVVARHGGTTVRIACPPFGEGRYWHVFALDGRTGDLEIINRLADARPVSIVAATLTREAFDELPR